MAHQKDERGDPITRTHEPVRKEYAARETRQGGPGVPILKVLGVSLVLAFLVWGVVELWGNRIVPSDPADGGQATSTSGTSTGTGNATPDGAIDDSVPDNSQTVPTDRDPTPQSGTGGDSQRVTPDGTAN
jgi:hypothetical protein